MTRRVNSAKRKRAHHPVWSEEDRAKLLAMADARAPVTAIAAALGRSVFAVKYQLQQLREKAQVAAQGVSPAALNGKAGLNSWRDKRAAEAVARVRNAEAAAQPRSLTAAICGDPLPGRSALDQRRPTERRITLPGMAP